MVQLNNILNFNLFDTGVNIIPFSIPFGIDKFERNGAKFFNWGQIFLNDNLKKKLRAFLF